MNYFIVSIFPEFFESFKNTTLISKAIENKIISIKNINPRNYTYDKHKTVDDTLYWGGAGLLLKAKPLIDSVEDIIKNISWKFLILELWPSEDFFDQKFAKESLEYENIILVCGRYEWIDARFWFYMNDKYPNSYKKISIWKYILLGWELPACIIVESISRLLPWVIKEEASHIDESYSTEKNMKNIEYPQFTKPQEVYGYKIPDILISGHHKKISDRRQENQKFLD